MQNNQNMKKVDTVVVAFPFFHRLEMLGSQL